MRILLANQPHSVFGGSETYLLTVAPYLQRLGHEVEIVAPAGGMAAELAERRALRVLADPEEAADPEVVLSQDGETAYAMAHRYPDAVRVYVIHSSIYEAQRPPQTEHVCQAIVALNDAMRDQSRVLAAHPEVIRTTQPIDTWRFTDRGARGERARRVLLLGNHWGGPGYRNFRIVAEACEELGLELDHVGTGGRISSTPEVEIANADVVMGLGRCVLEAMSSARAAYVFGNRGGDGWVTPDSYERMEAIGFAGAASTWVIDRANLVDDLGRFDADMGQVNRQLAVANHDAHRHAAKLIDVFRSLQPHRVADPAALDELERMVRVQRETDERAALAEIDSRRLRSENERLHSEHETATDELRRLRGHLDAVVNGRRYRIAQALGRPLDAIRRRR
jgi:hypothetical protein